MSVINNKDECICAMELLAVACGDMGAVNTIRTQARKYIPEFAKDIMAMATKDFTDMPRLGADLKRRYIANFKPITHYIELLLLTQTFANKIRAKEDREITTNEAMVYVQKLAAQEGTTKSTGIMSIFSRAEGIQKDINADTVKELYECFDVLYERVKPA